MFNQQKRKRKNLPMKSKPTIPEYTNDALLYILRGDVQARSAKQRLESDKNKVLAFKPMRRHAPNKGCTLATLHVYPKAKHKSYVKPIDKFCHRGYNLNIIV